MTTVSVIAILSSTASGAVPTPLTAAPELCPPNAKPVDAGCIDRSPGFVVYGERCKPARKAVPFYRSLTWERQEARGAELADRTPIVRGKTCRWSRYAASVHQARAKSALRSLERFVSTRTLRDFVVRDGSHAWLRAVNEAQKPYPGTKAWLLSCSSTEGGWGRWVPNSDGFPPGGWMQMYESTFWRMWRDGWYDAGRTYPGAVESLKARGYRVPRSAHSWYSPLGQALASAHGYANGRRGEWHSTGCYIN